MHMDHIEARLWADHGKQINAGLVRMIGDALSLFRRGLRAFLGSVGVFGPNGAPLERARVEPDGSDKGRCPRPASRQGGAPTDNSAA